MKANIPYLWGHGGKKRAQRARFRSFVANEVYMEVLEHRSGTIEKSMSGILIGRRYRRAQGSRMSQVLGNRCEDDVASYG